MRPIYLIESRTAGFYLESNGMTIPAMGYLLSIADGADALYCGQDYAFAEWREDPATGLDELICPLARPQREEIAAYMIALWQAWAQKGSDDASAMACGNAAGGSVGPSSHNQRLHTS